MAKKWKTNAFFVFLNHEETAKVISYIVESNSMSMPECSIFIQTQNKSDLVHSFGKYLRFDSNFNLIMDDHSNRTEIHEVYSVKTDNEIRIKTNLYGYFSHGRLNIEKRYLWDRRTDFLGTNFRLVKFLTQLKVLIWIQNSFNIPPV